MIREQEPFEYWGAVEGWVKIDEVRQHFDSVGCGTIYKTAGDGRVPLYTEPPKREWVRLDKDMNVTYLDIDLATTGPRSPYTALAIEVWNKAIKHAADNFQIDDDHYYDQVRESILENKK